MADVKVTQEGEIWVDVPGYEGLYEVSNFGRVWSQPRLRTAPIVKTFCRRNYGGKMLNPMISKTGSYHQVTLWKDRKVRMIRIHAIVMLAFVGPYPPGKKSINHIDGSKANNRFDNLEYCTPAQNNVHALATGLSKPFDLRNYRHRRLTPEKVLKIRGLYAEGITQKEICKRLSLLPGSVRGVVNGRTHKAI